MAENEGGGGEEAPAKEQADAHFQQFQEPVKAEESKPGDPNGVLGKAVGGAGPSSELPAAAEVWDAEGHQSGDATAEPKKEPPTEAKPATLVNQGTFELVYSGVSSDVGDATLKAFFEQHGKVRCMWWSRTTM